MRLDSQQQIQTQRKYSEFTSSQYIITSNIKQAFLKPNIAENIFEIKSFKYNFEIQQIKYEYNL